MMGSKDLYFDGIMNEFNKTKKCIACGCLAVLIITQSGPICKKCLSKMHQYPHLPHGGMSYDWPINDYDPSPGIETTVTAVSRTANEMPINYIYFN